MSFVDGALKTSAIVCMTAVTVTLSVATAGAVMYGPTIAQSIISTSDEISQTSSSIRGLTNSLNNSVGIVNSSLEEACKAAGTSMKAISEMLVCLAELMKTISTEVSDFSSKEENKGKICKLANDIITNINAVLGKIGEVKAINSKEINETVEEVHETVGILNNGIRSFFKECKDGAGTSINGTVLGNCIAALIRIFGGGSSDKKASTISTVTANNQ